MKRCDPSFCNDPPLGLVEGVPKNPAEFTEQMEKAARAQEEACE
jgi:hypothetical protein